LGPTAPSTAPVNAFPGATAPAPGSPYSYLMGVAGRPGVVPWLPSDEPPDEKSHQVKHYTSNIYNSICKTFYINIIWRGCRCMLFVSTYLAFIGHRMTI